MKALDLHLGGDMADGDWKAQVRRQLRQAHAEADCPHPDLCPHHAPAEASRIEDVRQTMFGIRRDTTMIDPVTGLGFPIDTLLQGGSVEMELMREQMFGFARDAQGNQTRIEQVFSGPEIFRASRIVPHNESSPTCACWGCLRRQGRI